MKKILIIMTIALLGCDELIRTQNKAPELTLNKTEILADGTSEIVLTAEADRMLAADQTIRFTTTAGSLIALPISPLSIPTSEITLTPRDKSVSVILISSLEEKESVIVSASVNNLVTMKTVKFNRSCPDEIKLLLDKTEISITDSIKVSLTFLRNDAHNVSLNTRMDCAISPDSIGSITPIIYSDSFGKASAIIKPLNSGSGSIILTSKSGCAPTKPVLVFKVK